MKKRINLLLIGWLATASLVPATQATDVNLEGYWRYFLQGARTYFPYGTSQSGRYSNLGAGYYRYGYISGGRISNRDSYRSGSLSLEFWQLDYYASGSGRIMFTRGFGPLYSNYYYPSVSKSGYFRSPNRWGYGKLVLTEYAGNGRWQAVDRINFGSYHKF